MSDTAQPAGRPRGAAEQNVEEFLYQKREKIYPRQVSGLFASLRVFAATLLLALYYGIPWITWNGRQAILFDLPARQFHLFGITFWPQDFIYLTALLIIAALSLFFFTALAGRLWCGYACPQTVWTESFTWIERRFEGNRAAQIRLDKAPWTARKFALKGGKHLTWIVYALFTGFTFVGYFTPIRELWTAIAGQSLSGWEWFWILFYSFATYGNAGWMREQVCVYMCPYARFQSAMFDRDTLIVSYDVDRGEPRAKGRRRANAKGDSARGDCIDCSLCVQVCPTGIDIRDGLQYRCIGCAACVDACGEVMEKMNLDKGLIRYTTENALQGKPAKLLRPRVILYASLLTAVMIALIVSIGLRTPLELNIIRDRNALYRETADGLISNIYSLRVMNKDQQPHRYQLVVQGIKGAHIDGWNDPVTAAPAEVINQVIEISVPPDQLTRASSEIEMILTSVDDPTIQVIEAARFIGPAPMR